MKKLITIFLYFSVFFSCEQENEPINAGSLSDDSWLIPVSGVFDGGPGKDGIPALENPNKTNDGGFLVDSELVVGYYDGNSAIAYPHQLLDWHEIINDELNEVPYAIIYCPLTGTAIGWDRTINGTVTTFGVSGLLYNNNLIPYDRATDSNWLQMTNNCVNGELQGEKAVTFQVVETSWGTWKTMFPDSKIVSLSTGFSRQYDRYPYGDYKTNNDFLLFPLSPDDNRLPRKERVHGIVVNGEAKVYRFSAFDDTNKLISDTFQETDIIIIGNASNNFIISFNAKLADGSSPEFTAIDEGSLILSDAEGNKWDVFGYAVEGPRTGQRLIPTKSYMGYWFVWGTFYPQPDIYE